MQRIRLIRTHVLALAVAGVVAATAAVAAPQQAASQAASPEQCQQRAGQMFDIVDANKDGSISRAEAAARPRLAERFDRLDANKDGRISREEWTQAHARSDWSWPCNGQQRRGDRAQMQQRRAEFFSQADSNKDDRLSRAEFEAAHAVRHAQMAGRMQQRRGERAAQGRPAAAQAQCPQRDCLQMTEQQRAERMMQMFSRMDSDNDGYISRAEFDNAPHWGQGRRGNMGPQRPGG